MMDTMNFSSYSLSSPGRYGVSRRAGYIRTCKLLVIMVVFGVLVPYQSKIYRMVSGSSWLETGRVSSSMSAVYSGGVVEQLKPRPTGSKEVLREFGPSTDAPGSKEVPREVGPSTDVGAGGSGTKSLKKLSLSEYLSVLNNTSPNNTRTDGPRSDKKDMNRSHIARRQVIKYRMEPFNQHFTPNETDIHVNLIPRKFGLVIKLLTSNRYGSLVRCLKSLAAAEYAGDKVDLFIYVDHFKLAEEQHSQRSKPESRRLLEVAHVNQQAFLNRTRPTQRQTFPSNSSSNVAGKSSKTVGTRDVLPNTPKNLRSPSVNSLAGEKSATGGEVLDTLYGEDIAKPGTWAATQKNLRDALRILNYVDLFQWEHGQKFVHYRSQLAGIQGQWVESWWPSSDDEFAFMVEEDMEVSPLFYRYVRSLIGTYYYQPEQFDPSIYGISLQRPQTVPGKNGQPLVVDDRTRLFLYQMVGPWGQVLFPRPWKEFRLWFDAHKSKNMKPILEDMLTTKWYRNFGERVWTPWFVKFVHAKGYFNMYTNFLSERALSVSHRETGENLKSHAGCDSNLIWANATMDLDMWHAAPMSTLKRYDLCFKEVARGGYVSKPEDVYQVLRAGNVSDLVVVVSSVGVSDVFIRSWLCRAAKQSPHSYLVVGNNVELLRDLARRGHMVMELEDRTKSEEYFIAEANLMLCLLKAGFSVWYAKADTIWLGNPLQHVGQTTGSVVGIERSELDLFFIHSSKQTMLLWGNFCSEIANKSKTTSRDSIWETARESFVKECRIDNRVRVLPLEVVFVDVSKLPANPVMHSTSANTVSQVVRLDELRTWKIPDAISKLKKLRLWNMDEDLACAVSCSLQ